MGCQLSEHWVFNGCVAQLFWNRRKGMGWAWVGGKGWGTAFLHNCSHLGKRARAPVCLRLIRTAPQPLKGASGNRALPALSLRSPPLFCFWSVLALRVSSNPFVWEQPSWLSTSQICLVFNKHTIFIKVLQYVCWVHFTAYNFCLHF